MYRKEVLSEAIGKIIDEVRELPPVGKFTFSTRNIERKMKSMLRAEISGKTAGPAGDIGLNFEMEKDSLIGTIGIFFEPSRFGINKGRISKLSLFSTDFGLVGKKFVLPIPGTEKLVAQYDRRWDVKPKGAKVKKIVDKLVKIVDEDR